MSFETAKMILDNEFSKSEGYDLTQIDLFGGEPFLEFDLIKNITKYVEQNFNGYNYVATILYTIKGPNGKSIVLPVRPWVGYAKDCSYWINEMYNTTDAYYFTLMGGATFSINHKGVNYTQDNYIRPVLK